MNMKKYNDRYHLSEAEKVLGRNKYLLYDQKNGYRLSEERPVEYEIVDYLTFKYKSVSREGDFLARWAHLRDYQEIRCILTALN